MALSSPGFRLRGRDGELLPERRPCLACGTLLSAYAPASDRFCLLCAPRLDDEPPHEPALYCARGHLRADWEVVRIDNSRAAGKKTECRACKQARDRQPEARSRHAERLRCARASARSRAA